MRICEGDRQEWESGFYVVDKYWLLRPASLEEMEAAIVVNMFLLELSSDD